MNIERITMRAGRTFNHPSERFANFSFSIEMEAALVPNDNPASALLELRCIAETAAEQHKSDILSDLALEQQRQKLIRTIAVMERAPERIADMQARIRRITTETRVKIEAGDVEVINQWCRGYPDTAEEREASAMKQIDVRAKELQEEIEGEQKKFAMLDSMRTQYADLPAPRLLTLPEKQIYPGHPDHPETGDNEWD